MGKTRRRNDVLIQTNTLLSSPRVRRAKKRVRELQSGLHDRQLSHIYGWLAKSVLPVVQNALRGAENLSVLVCRLELD